MRKIATSLLVAALACAGCGQKEPPAEAPQAATPPPAEAQAAAPEPEAAAPAAEAGRNDGESVEAATASVSPIAKAYAANTPEPPAGDLGRWKDGEHFQSYPVAQPVDVPPGQVEVVEGFWYGCGHCYALEPRLEAWAKSKPDWIVLRRVPVVWNEVTREDARLFFAIESLGRLDDLHGEVFRQIHARKRPLTVINGGRVDRAATEKAAREFLASHGVSAEDFAKHYRTFSTETRLRQAENLSRRYLLDHTPMMVVHGKYLTDVEMAGGVDQLFQLVTDLATREREST